MLIYFSNRIDYSPVSVYISVIRALTGRKVLNCGFEVCRLDDILIEPSIDPDEQ
jgi:hypothetical protein